MRTKAASRVASAPGARLPPGLEGNMRFPKVDFADEKACFRTLFKFIHPEGWACPDCHERDGIRVHENHRLPWRIVYQCTHCRRYFNAWTSTDLEGTHYTPSEILRMMQTHVQGESNLQLARELDRDPGKLAKFFQRRLQRLTFRLFGP